MPAMMMESVDKRATSLYGRSDVEERKKGRGRDGSLFCVFVSARSEQLNLISGRATGLFAEPKAWALRVGV